MSVTPISPLRRRMIEDMTIRNFSADTQRNYIRAIKNLAIFLGRSPDTVTPEDLRLFQLHLTENRVRPPTINATVSALRFFFNVTVDRPDVTRPLTSVAEPRKIPVVLNPDEVVRFSGGRARAEVQGGVRSGLWRGPARVGGGSAEGLRHRLPAHDDPDRARQRA
jgi:integrase/recombinase XerD